MTRRNATAMIDAITMATLKSLTNCSSGSADEEESIMTETTTTSCSISTGSTTSIDEVTEEEFCVSSSTQSVLVLGATGKVGVEIVQQLANSIATQRQDASFCTPLLFGMIPDLQTVPQDVMKKQLEHHIEMLIDGDAAKPADLHRALLLSHADTVVVSLADDPQHPTLRTQAAEALVKVLRHPPFCHIRVIVHSWAPAAAVYLPTTRSTKAAPKRWQAWREKLLAGEQRRSSQRLEAVLGDHARQEQVLLGNHSTGSSTTIVRPEQAPEQHGSNQLRTSTKLSVLAKWVADEVLLGGSSSLSPVAGVVVGQ